VRYGNKTEWRASPGTITQLWNVTLPMLVVGYAIRGGEHESCLLVLEATWQEMLAGISAESLAREGFPDMAHFRRYWMKRTQKRFRPLDKVQVFRVHRASPEEIPELGRRMIERLYQEHV
jgi:hypothetical protein